MKAQSCFFRLLASGLGALLLAGSATGGIAPPVAAGIGRPAVRVNAQSLDKIGTGNIIFSSQVIFNGDAALITGDVYAQANVTFPQYRKSPLWAGGATATNLISPQVLAGTVISSGSGPTVAPPCGGRNNPGAFTTECASASLTEVAPTPCPGGGRAVDRGYPAPVNWHPMTPIGMTSADFTAVVTAGSLPIGTTVAQATQNGIGVMYAQARTYTPTYWRSIPATFRKVMLITANQPFCVNPSAASVTLPVPVITGVCSPGYVYYGSQAFGIPYTTRFLDWGLVTDDLSRGTARTFFQAPTCGLCGLRGNPNGIRYIPLLPPTNVLAQACARNVNPGVNVFDEVAALDGILCATLVETTSATSVTLRGTNTNPEGLVIDNGEQPVWISPSTSGTAALTCTNTNFDRYNWGLILATGDVALGPNMIFSGFIYTRGNIFLSGHTLVRGGIFAASIQGAGTQFSSVVAGDSTGDVIVCGR